VVDDTKTVIYFGYRKDLTLNKEYAISVESDYLDAAYLEVLTGTKASTWRYWATTGRGPASFRLGRRRVWRRAEVLAWLAEQESATGVGGGGQ
jgi:prophage regulatory protein